MIIRYNEENYPSSLKGYFLISETNMSDPNFYRTVILILEHNDEGAFGLVVNRRSHLTLAEILPEFNNERGKKTPVYVGGPVQQEFLFVIHSDLPAESSSSSELASIPALGIHFEPSFRHIQHYFDDDHWSSLSESKKPHIHLFLGYSGWAPGQLEREMENGSWMVIKASPRIVFYPNPEDGWKEALREKGGIYKIFADSGQEPSLN